MTEKMIQECKNAYCVSDFNGFLQWYCEGMNSAVYVKESNEDGCNSKEYVRRGFRLT